MGYLLNEDQQAIVSSVKAFMEKEVAPVCAECDLGRAAHGRL